MTRGAMDRHRLAINSGILALALLLASLCACAPFAESHQARASLKPKINLSWLTPSQSRLRITLRGNRPATAEHWWFNLSSTSGIILDCASTRVVKYGNFGISYDVPNLLGNDPLDNFYCDGSHVSGRLPHSAEEGRYGIVVMTHVLSRAGTFRVSGAVGKSGIVAGATATKSKSTLQVMISPPRVENLTWSDEFNGAKATDLASWTVANNSTYGAAGGSTNIMRSGDRNVRVNDGHLTVQARREIPSRENKNQPFSSGYLTSAYLLNLSKPGRLDVRMNPNMTAGRSKGKWGGVWLRNRRTQEFDLSEMIGTSRVTAAQSTRWQTSAHFNTLGVSRRSEIQAYAYRGSPNSYHVWSMVWDGMGRVWVSCDGQELAYFDVRQNPWLSGFVGMFQMRINLFMQGHFPGPVDRDTEFSSGLEVDYLRYYTM